MASVAFLAPERAVRARKLGRGQVAYRRWRLGRIGLGDVGYLRYRRVAYGEDTAPSRTRRKLVARVGVLKIHTRKRVTKGTSYRSPGDVSVAAA